MFIYRLCINIVSTHSNRVCLFVCLFVCSFVCLFFGLNVASTIFQSYRDGVWMWQGAQCSLLECCLTEISRPRHFDMIFYPVKLHVYWHWADQFRFLALLSYNVERQAKEQLVPFLKSLVWLGRRSNPQPPGHEADALPTEPLCRYLIR